MVEEEKEAVSSPRRRQRSPNFPSIDLRKAVERIHLFYDKEGRNEAPIDVVAQHWGYSKTSSSIDKMLGALNAYGLIEIKGSRESRMIRLSERGLILVEDERPESAERKAALRDAALDPTVHAAIRSKHGANLPSDLTIRTWLVREQHFTKQAADAALANFRSSIEYAGLDSSTVKGDNGLDHGGEGDPQNVVVGSLVQWTSQGVEQFATPQKVIALSDDGEYAFVKCTKTGLPIQDLTVQADTSADAVGVKAPPLNPHFSPEISMSMETSRIGRGVAKLSWPESLTKADYDDLEYWLQGVLRKAERSIQDKPEEEDPD